MEAENSQKQSTCTQKQSSVTQIQYSTPTEQPVLAPRFRSDNQVTQV